VSPLAPTGPTHEPRLDEEAAFAAIAWESASDIEAARDRCTVGDPFACLALGEFELAKPKKGNSAQAANDYLQRAYGILVVRCRKREPDACTAIARMYRLGLAMSNNKTAVPTLLSHSRDLCRLRPGRVCAALK
jgi:hypothetical protein